MRPCVRAAIGPPGGVDDRIVILEGIPDRGEPRDPRRMAARWTSPWAMRSWRFAPDDQRGMCAKWSFASWDGVRIQRRTRGDFRAGPVPEVGHDRQEELGRVDQARRAQRTQNWDEAELILFNLKRLYPSTPLYSYSSEQATRYRPEPVGPRWDGVDAFDSK
jgi:hypothetical protein